MISGFAVRRAARARKQKKEDVIIVVVQQEKVRLISFKRNQSSFVSPLPLFENERKSHLWMKVMEASMGYNKFEDLSDFGHRVYKKLFQYHNLGVIEITFGGCGKNSREINVKIAPCFKEEAILNSIHNDLNNLI